MGGYPGGLAGAQEPFGPFSGAAQRFFDVNGGGPPTAAEKARLKLFLDAFPGLAGAPHMGSVYPDNVARSLGTLAAPPHAAGLGGNLGTFRGPITLINRHPNWFQQPPEESTRPNDTTLQRPSNLRPAHRRRRRLTRKTTSMTSPES